MITLRSTSLIDASPEKIWHFLTHLHEGDTYLRWHPNDHKAFRLLSGDGVTVGSTFQAVEMLGGKQFRLRYRLNRVEPLRCLAYGASGLLRPLRIATGTFTLKPIGVSKTELMAEVRIGYRAPVIGLVVDWIARKSVNLAAIQKHMDEEGHYLSTQLIERACSCLS